MVRISAVFGIVCYFVLAGRVVASTKADRVSMLCMEGDCGMRQDVICRRCRDV